MKWKLSRNLVEIKEKLVARGLWQDFWKNTIEPYFRDYRPSFIEYMLDMIKLSYIDDDSILLYHYETDKESKAKYFLGRIRSRNKFYIGQINYEVGGDA